MLNVYTNLIRQAVYTMTRAATFFHNDLDGSIKALKVSVKGETETVVRNEIQWLHHEDASLFLPPSS